MGCFGCKGDSSSTKKPKKERKDLSDDTHGTHYGRDDRGEPTKDASTVEPKKGGNEEDCTVINLSAAVEEDNARRRASGNAGVSGSTKCRTFAFSELQAASENFRRQNFLGEGGFGKVYKGRLEDTGEIVAIKRLDPDGSQGTQEFFVEVAFLSCAKHPNLVELIGCCFEGFHRMLVYEFMPLGSLDIHLHGRIASREQLDWSTRMKIAAGAARGLEYLHHRMNPPVVYRDLKCSNILLGEGYHAKLSDFGLARTGPHGDKTHVSTRVMGTYGYCAPEYALTGQLTLKSDIYSFGVVLLEIVTGRKAIDEFRFQEERNLVSWAKPLLADRKKWVQLVDPALEDRYPSRGFHQALSVATMCLQEKAALRPAISDVVLALDYLASQKNTSDK